MTSATAPCPSCATPVAAAAPMGLCPRCLMEAALQPASAAPGMRRFVAPPVAELEALFPQFEILELLGQGGMGAVYKAVHRKLDRLVALKILPRELASDPSFEERFLREARALARLQHPHLIGVHDFGETQGLFFLVMEFVDGPNLRQLLQRGCLPPERALAIVPQVCEALQYAHDQGVVHRDIKPENILIDEQGQVRIADFGLARIAATQAGAYSLTGSSVAVGTPHYMAPEQLETPEHVDHRADIYSLGVVFYEMLTGKLPLGKFPPPSKKAAVGAHVDDVVLRSLEPEPEERWQDAHRLKSEVERLHHASPPPPADADAPAPEKPGDEFFGLVGAIGTSVDRALDFAEEVEAEEESMPDAEVVAAADRRRLRAMLVGALVAGIGAFFPWGHVPDSHGEGLRFVTMFNGTIDILGLRIPALVQAAFFGNLFALSLAGLLGVRPVRSVMMLLSFGGLALAGQAALDFFEGTAATPGIALPLLLAGYLIALLHATHLGRAPRIRVHVLAPSLSPSLDPSDEFHTRRSRAAGRGLGITIGAGVALLGCFLPWASFLATPTFTNPWLDSLPGIDLGPQRFTMTGWVGHFNLYETHLPNWLQLVFSGGLVACGLYGLVLRRTPHRALIVTFAGSGILNALLWLWLISISEVVLGIGTIFLLIGHGLALLFGLMRDEPAPPVVSSRA